MLNHRPLSLLNFEKGRFTADEAWSAPPDTFREVYDAAVIDGVLRVRPGFSWLSALLSKQSGLMVSGTIVQNLAFPSAGSIQLSADNISLPYSLRQFRSLPPGPYNFKCNDGTEEWQDTGTVDAQGRAILSGTLGGAGLLELREPTGQDGCILTLVRGDQPNPIGSNLTIVQYEGNVGNDPVMACGEFVPQSDPDAISIWAVSQRRFFVWVPGERIFEDYTDRQPSGVAGTIFTGTEDDRFWCEPFGDRMILTNGVDEPWWYAPLDDGSPTNELLRPMELVFDEDQAGGPPDPRRIWAAKIAIQHKGKILWTHTKEGTVAGGSSNATWFPQRVRRSQTNNAEAFVGSDQPGGSLRFSDAPTNKRITSAALQGNDVTIFFDDDETWSHDFIESARTPYIWRDVSLMRGAAARKSAIQVYQSVMALDRYALILSDGRSLVDIDDDITRYVIDRLDPSLLQRSEGFVYFDDDQSWHTTYRIGNETPETLVRHYKQPNFAIYQWPFSCFGWYRNIEGRLAVDDYTTPPFPPTVDEYDPGIPVDAYVGGTPVERNAIGGTRDGNVYLIGGSSNDSGAAIQFRVITQRLNPSKNQEDLHFGWVSFVTTAHPGKQMTVRFFRDFQFAQYREVTFDLSPVNGERKVRRLVNVNQVASYHQMEIVANDVPGLQLEGIDLWLAPISATVKSI